MARVTPSENPITDDDIKPYDDAPIRTANGVRERARDPFQLTKEQQATGKPGFTPYWGRDGRVWTDEIGDRTQEILDCCDGAYLARNERNEIIRKGRDLNLVWIPNHYVESADAVHEQVKRDGEKNLQENPYEPGVYSSHEKLFDPSDRDQVEERRAANSAAMIRAGMIGPGSPTSGMSLVQAERMYSDADIAAEEERWRRGAAHVQMTEEQWESMLTARDDRLAEVRPARTKASVGYNKKYADNYDAVFGKRGTATSAQGQKGR